MLQELIPLSCYSRTKNAARLNRERGSPGSRRGCARARGSVYCDFVTVLRLFCLSGQEHAQRPLDRPGTGTAYGFAGVAPNLRPFEIGVATHEGPLIFRFVLASGALPGSLQTDFLAGEGAVTHFTHRPRSA